MSVKRQNTLKNSCRNLNTDIYKLLKCYRKKQKKTCDLQNPKTFSEKIQWLKIFNATPIKTKLADKYSVRDWIKEKIGEKHLIPLLGVYENFNDIDFSSLPDQFVIKCNHGSGYNLIVKNKKEFNIQDARKKVEKWLKENYASKTLEMHYTNIKPLIVVEKYLKNEQSDDLYDYKLWCFDGKVKYIQVMSERNTQNIKMALYDTQWKKQDFIVNHAFDEKNLPKPEKLEEMVKIAETLSDGFCFVRVDLYLTDTGEIYSAK